MGSLRFAWWNLENLFDTVDDPISADFDFTAGEGWTQELFDAKKANLAGAINELHAGQGPELLGVAEVEGDDVFEQLLAATATPTSRSSRIPTAHRTSAASTCRSRTTTAS